MRFVKGNYIPCKFKFDNTDTTLILQRINDSKYFFVDDDQYYIVIYVRPNRCEVTYCKLLLYYIQGRI